MMRGTGTSGKSRSDDLPEGGNPSFSVVVPIFNERLGAQRCVREIARALDGLPNRTALIVVDDGSRDGTAAILKDLTRICAGLEVITHPVNRGYGAALVTGAARAAERGLDYVLFMDSDLTNSPEDIPRFAAKMSEGFDVIKASRFVPGGRMVGVPWTRVMVSRLGNLVARGLYRLSVRDCTNGFRAVRTSLLIQMDLRERGFPIIMEELYWCRFLARSFAEVPVTLINAARVSSFRYRPAVFLAYLRYPLRSLFGIAPDVGRSVSRSGE
jgi:dolichol-phosphate mannosyltransferase